MAFGLKLPAIKNDPRHTEEYLTYLGSMQWQALRHRLISRAGYRCQDCNVLSMNHLQVHHLTYDRLGHERDEDLRVLCVDCHTKADTERRSAVAIENQNALANARLDGWASKVYGDDWYLSVSTDEAWSEFSDWVDRRGDS